MLEFEEIAGRVEQHEGTVLLDHALEPGRDVMEERDLADDRAVMQGLEVRRIGERDTEVPRVEARRFLDGRPGLGEVADQLIAEEIRTYPVRDDGGRACSRAGLT